MATRAGDDDVKRTAERLQLALAAGQLGDWSWDAASDLVYFGERGAEIFGVSNQQPITWESLRLLLAPEDSERARLAVEQALADGMDYGIEYRVIRPDGRQIWVAAQGRAVYDAQGKTIGMIGVVRDVTDRRRIDETSYLLAAVVDSSDDAIVSKSLDGIISSWNAGAQRIFGYTPEEAIGKPVLMLIPAGREHEEFEILSRLRRGEHIEHFETERIRKGGGSVYVSLAVSPVKDANGVIIGASKIARDITDRKRVEDNLRRNESELRTLLETGATLSSTLELEKLLQTVTDAGTQLTGATFGAFFYNTTDAEGESYLLYTLSGAPRGAFEKFGRPRATPLFGPTFRGEKPIRSGNILDDPRYGQLAPHFGMPAGHLPVCSYLAVPVISPTGEVIGGLFFGHPDRDVFSERAERLIVGVASQAAFALENARLYEKVLRAVAEREDLLSAERAARSEAERVNVMKDEFLATLSHELRTPLHAILGWAQVLKLGDSQPDELREGLDAIERNARTQTQLIDDLLDMSRIISGKIRLDVQWIDPSAAIEAAFQAVRHSADAKEIRLRKIYSPGAGPIAGDLTRLQQIVWNLLSNAIKFTPKGGTVDVLLQRANSQVEITVRDSGIGIAPEFLPLVFERFRQADASTTRHFGGLGLGLAIVKNLVELHGGTIRATSAGQGQGAAFIVSLPLAPVKTDEAGAHRPGVNSPAMNFERVNLQGITVLVVDDEDDARSMIQRVLAQSDAKVLLAANAGEALTLMAGHKPDVLVSDIGMPDVDGYQFMRQVRRLPADQGGRTPAIALTAFARAEDRTRAMLAGYQVHIVKPIEATELLATVGSLAGRTGES